MDNINVKKIYDEDGLIELRIQASSEFISAYQHCYVQDMDLKESADKIIDYSNNFDEDCYIEFGKKEGDYTPAFSLKLLKADTRGHLKIEVDLEIADNESRSHRCCFYVESELGLIENFGQALKKLVESEIDSDITLHE